MPYHRRRKIEAPAGGIGTHILSMSLFIIMLAFFILLNAISTFEKKKAEPLMSGVSDAFAITLPDKGKTLPSLIANQGEGLREGNAFEEMEALFSATIPSAGMKATMGEGEMHVALPFGAFESALNQIAQGGKPDSDAGKQLLPALVALIRDDRLPVPYRMDIMLNVNGNPAALQNTKPQDMQRLAARLSAIAQKAENSGLPAKQIGIGFVQGKDGMVDLYFRPHVPFNPDGPQP